jgi:hypothetical protein
MHSYRLAKEMPVIEVPRKLHLSVVINTRGSLELRCSLPEQLMTCVTASLMNLADYKVEGGVLTIFLRCISGNDNEKQITRIQDFCTRLANKSGVNISSEVVRA